MGRFIIKKNICKKPLQYLHTVKFENANKIEKTVKDMDTQEKIMLANAVLGQTNQNEPIVKKVRKEKGLIEKTESSKIILTEDNRELLND